jgi:hypothetical protein
MYFPCFFLLKGFVLGEENIVEYAVNKYKTEISDSVKALWMVWVPGQVKHFFFFFGRNYITTDRLPSSLLIGPSIEEGSG